MGFFFGFFKSDPRRCTKGSRPLGTRFNLAPRVFSFTKMSAAILKKEKTLGLG